MNSLIVGLYLLDYVPFVTDTLQSKSWGEMIKSKGLYRTKKMSNDSHQTVEDLWKCILKVIFLNI